MGVPRTDDYNGPVQEGVAYFDQTAKKGLRCSSAKAFLTPIKNRQNLTIATFAQTSGLVFAEHNPKQVTGVAYRQQEAARTAHLAPGGEVILSAGAIGSPQLLELSGIGQPEVLKAAGVTLRHELAGVGEALQDHLQIRLVFETNVPTLNDMINSPLGKMKIGLQYALGRSGPMSLGASQVAIFAKSMPGLATPDIQFHFQPLSADKPGLVIRFPALPHQFASCARKAAVISISALLTQMCIRALCQTISAQPQTSFVRYARCALPVRWPNSLR